MTIFNQGLGPRLNQPWRIFLSIILIFFCFIVSLRIENFYIRLLIICIGSGSFGYLVAKLQMYLED